MNEYIIEYLPDTIRIERDGIDGFCAWSERRETWTTCKCGESIELGGREYAVCPSCGRTVVGMTHMDIFSTRFAELIDSVGEDATDFGVSVNRERKTVYRWKNGKGYPTVPALIRICETYGVSADWLLGIDSGVTA